MYFNDKEKEIHFHVDRSTEAATTLLKSIVENPRLDAEQQFSLLVKLARHHQDIVAQIGGSMIAGQSMFLAGLASPDERA